MSEEKKTKKPVPDAADPAAVVPASPDPTDEALAIIEEAKAKAAEIVAAAEAKAKENEERAAKAAEAEAAAAAAKTDPGDEPVEYTAPLLPGVKKRDIFVAVNGETLRIQRGIPVKIKRKFYEALQNAAKQEFAAYESREQIRKQGEKPLASM